jgi:hypothetical protein
LTVNEKEDFINFWASMAKELKVPQGMFRIA